MLLCKVLIMNRWLLLCNPMLADLISDKIGDDWPVHLDQLAQIKQWADDKKFQRYKATFQSPPHHPPPSTPVCFLGTTFVSYFFLQPFSYLPPFFYFIALCTVLHYTHFWLIAEKPQNINELKNPFLRQFSDLTFKNS